MDMDIVRLSEEVMRKQTLKNGAPNRLLTEIAVQKGKELAKKYGVDERLVVTSLYLAHTVFDQIWKGEVQKNHPQLSAEFAEEYLNAWKVSQNDQAIILNAILAHHGKIATSSQVAEIVKNAECFKFITIQGSLIRLHELGSRQVAFDVSVERVIQKMEQKRALLTLPECIQEAEINCKKIRDMFATITE